MQALFSNMGLEPAPRAAFSRATCLIHVSVGCAVKPGVVTRQRDQRLKVNNTRRLGFTLVEVLIVVVIMAAVVIPQFGASTDDAKKSAAEFNLSIMRSSLQTYIGQHGLMPVINGTQDLADVMTNH